MKRSTQFRSRLLGSVSISVLTLGLSGFAATGAMAAVAGLPFSGFDAAIQGDDVAPTPFVLVDDDDDGDDDDGDDDDGDDDDDDDGDDDDGDDDDDDDDDDDADSGGGPGGGGGRGGL